MNSQAQILLSTERQGCLDCQYFGSVFLANKEGIYKSTGLKENEICFMRSLAKPLQASVLVDTNILSDCKLNSKEIAIMCASHAGSPLHIKTIRSLMKKLNIKYSELEIMPTLPLDTRGFSGKKTKLHNNCSAKHIMMIAVSKYYGFNPRNYCNVNHPIQKLIKKRQEELSGYKSKFLSYDGCTTPLWGLPFENIITAYFNLLHDEKYEKIISSVIKNPYIFGGFERLDTKIIQKSKGNLFSKVGAGGLVLVYNFKKDEILLVKMTQNNNAARELITFDILNKLGWISCNIEKFEYNQKKEPVAKYCYEFKLN